MLTTVTGMGGGLVMVIVLSAAWGPYAALPITALALMVGNLHRLALFRAHVDTRVARRILVGLVPGALIGALLVAGLPAGLLHGAMLLLVVLTLARALFGWRWRLPRAALPPAGVAVGVMAGTAGGAGVLTAPLLLSSGVEGDRYLATLSLIAVVMHTTRVIGYSAGGLVGGATVLWAALLAVTVVVGNTLGRSLRRRVPRRSQSALAYLALTGCAVLSLIGAA